MKLETSPSVTPRTIPEAVRTVGDASGAVVTTVFGVAGVGVLSGPLLFVFCALAEVKRAAASSIQSAMKDIRNFLLIEFAPALTGGWKFSVALREIVIV